MEKKGGLYGGSNNTLDEKGRLSFPARLRNAFTGSTVVETCGLDRCLWIFPPELWEEFAGKVADLPTAQSDARRIKEHFLGSAIEVEIDKSGRLPIPQNLREFAGLSRDCKVMGVGKHIEVWDASRYEEHNSANNIAEIAEKFVDLF